MNARRTFAVGDRVRVSRGILKALGYPAAFDVTGEVIGIATVRRSQWSREQICYVRWPEPVGRVSRALATNLVDAARVHLEPV